MQLNYENFDSNVILNVWDFILLFFHKLRLNVDYSKIWCYECVCMWLSFYYRISFAFRFQWKLSILSIRIMRDVMENVWINRCVIPSYLRYSITALYVHHQMIREWKLKKFLIFISGHKLGCIGFGTVNFGIGSATVQYSLSFGRSDPIVLGFLRMLYTQLDMEMVRWVMIK